MAKFFVGQRVKCVRSFTGRHQGRDGVVDSTNWCGGTDTGRYLDGALRVVFGDGDSCVGEPFRFEPILPEGAAPSEFTTLADLLASLEVTA